MNINSACILEDRGILFVDGIDAKDFLQNIITNDIDKVSDNSSCFASLLTPQGKFLFDFIVVKHKKGYFIDCEKIQIEELFKQFSLYKIIKKRVRNLKISPPTQLVIAAEIDRFENYHALQTKLPTKYVLKKNKTIFFGSEKKLFPSPST